MNRLSSWSSFLPAIVVAGAGIGAGLFSPAYLQDLIFAARDLIVQRAGWSYILLDALFLGFVLVLALGPWGRIKLGREDQPPDFSTLTWFALMFCTALAAGLVFFGVAEPLYHYSNPPPFSQVEARTEEAARWAMVTSYFHWGLNAWCIYLILPIPLAYMVHRKGLPCRVSTALVPILGEAAHGWSGKLVDGLAVLVSVAGMATSLGYIGLQLAGGLHYFYGLPAGAVNSLVIVGVLTLVIVLSVASGLNRGIRILSNFNARLGLVLLLFVFIAGPSFYVLKLGLQSLAEYLWTLPLLSFRMPDGQDRQWVQQWTVVYYAWWFSWAPMVGLFYVRVSRGRTIRQLVLMGLFAPVAASAFWFASFGGSALYFDLYGQAEIAAVISQHGMEYPIFALLAELPLAGLAVPLFLLLIAVFFITSGDSSSLSMAILSSGGNPDPPLFMRVFWGLMQGALAAVLLSLGGIAALQAASIVAGFFIMFLLLAALFSAIVMIRWDRATHWTVVEEVAAEADR